MVVAAVGVACVASSAHGGADEDRAAVEKTNAAIRAAFARGDIATIIAYHHPDVVKALSFQKYLDGREAVAADVRAALEQHRLEFVEHRVESLWIQDNVAVELSVFAIKGTPKGEGKPFLVRGRAMLVYVRYEKSPSGWALFRETVQPAGD